MRVSECVCVCVRERERERKERVSACPCVFDFLIFRFAFFFSFCFLRQNQQSTQMSQRGPDAALANFKRVFGKDVSEYVDAAKDLTLWKGKCDSLAKVEAVAAILGTNAKIDRWSGRL